LSPFVDNRFQIGSRNALANRKYRRFCTGSLARKWSMRKTAGSGKDSWRIALRAFADARSRPNGFSTITRACAAQPDRARPDATVPNKLGGIAR
jgi:hypothetical protein